MGQRKKNPFNFEHMNANLLAFYVDNVSRPSVPFTMDYKNKDFAAAYLSQFEGTGKYMKDSGNYISRTDYFQGYAVYVIDLTSNHNKEVENLPMKGHTRLSIQFSEPLPSTTSVVVYAHFPGMLQIHRARNVVIK